MVPDYHALQFKGKPVKQTPENDEKPNFRPYFGMFGPNLGTKIYFSGIYLYYALTLTSISTFSQTIIDYNFVCKNV